MQTMFRSEEAWGKSPRMLEPTIQSLSSMEGEGELFFLKNFFSYKNRSICKTISQPGGSTSHFLGDRGEGFGMVTLQPTLQMDAPELWGRHEEGLSGQGAGAESPGGKGTKHGRGRPHTVTMP